MPSAHELTAGSRPAGEPVPAGGWTVAHHAVVESTQAVARVLPAWSAVVADAQSAGRGQRDRSFTSDAGGLYVSAVVPFDGDALAWRGFALAIGRGVLNALTAMGIEDLRLRWPNDLMIGPRKVGGILVEQGGPRTLLVGLGINITNRPWLTDHALRYVAGRLLDHTDRALTGPAQLLEPVLEGIRRAHEEFASRRLAGMASALNECWGVPRHVWLEAAGEVELAESQGAFAGIEEDGRVRLARPDGSVVSIPEHHIQRLIEVE
jgi:BirA family transcriptional regulator, biotin operon repressor / biotin---[acetyl-CoA-carboxylase] ligase